jgi:hypothetical protein
MPSLKRSRRLWAMLQPEPRFGSSRVRRSWIAAFAAQGLSDASTGQMSRTPSGNVSGGWSSIDENGRRFVGVHGTSDQFVIAIERAKSNFQQIVAECSRSGLGGADRCAGS